MSRGESVLCSEQPPSKRKMRNIGLVFVVSTLFGTVWGLSTPETRLLHLPGGQGINLWKLRPRSLPSGHSAQTQKAGLIIQGQTNVASNMPKNKWKPHFFTQPLDHFDPTNNQTFKQRYWVDDRFYTNGGPVIVIDGGETSGEDRLPFLEHGILTILSNATGGLSVVLEHRYYGESIPVANFSTDSLRWLNNAQALQDSANFMGNVQFPSIKEDLTAPGTPWIYYGGSYAGARAAHMKVLYPDLVYGAIGSSAVTHAEIDYSDYFEVIRRTNNQECVEHIRSAIITIDKLLDIPVVSKGLKALFGLQALEHDDDFVSLLTQPLGAVQDTNWDSAVSSDSWDRFCGTISRGGAGSKIGMVKIPAEVMHYATWIREEVVQTCESPMTIEECFGTYDDEKFQDISITSSWRAWLFQVCTEWGYFMPAPADPDQPSLLSRRITLEYASKQCQQSFPPGKHFSIPTMPDVSIVNDLGDYDIESPRLALIDGSRDPWLAATPHSWHAKHREDTINKPFKMIPLGVHHWDENSLRMQSRKHEPAFIAKVHAEEVEFVQAWLKDWKPERLDRAI